MSVRAYRITKFDYAEAATFNLWLDEELMKLLDPYMPEWFSRDNGGYLEFSQEDLAEALVTATEQHATAKTIAVLKEMLTQAKDSDNGWVRYWCF